MLPAVALAFVLFQQPYEKPSKPVVIAGPIKAGRCRVPIDVAGQSYLFLIDTGIEKSYIRGDVKAAILKRDTKAVLSFGAGSIAVADLPNQKSSVYMEVPAIAGIVGMDVLCKVSFSVDYDEQELTLWPEGSSEAEIEASLFLRKRQKVASIPLISETGYLSPFIQTSLGECELDTGASVSLLSKSAAKSPEVFSTSLSKPLELFEGGLGRATEVVVRNFQIGDQDLFCQHFLLSDSVDVGVISASQLSKTIYFDFPGKRVVIGMSSRIDQACSGISSLLHGKVTRDGGQLYLLAASTRNLGPTQSPLVRIVSIDGRKGSEWLRMYLSRDPTLADTLRKAYDSLSKNGSVIVERDGKEEKLLIAPFLRP